MIFVSLFYALGIILARTLCPSPFVLVVLSLLCIFSLLIYRKNTILLILVGALLLGAFNTGIRSYVASENISRLKAWSTSLKVTVTAVKRTQRSLLLTCAVPRSSVKITVLVKGRLDTTPVIGQEMTLQPPFEWSEEQGRGSSLFLPIAAAQVTMGRVKFSVARALNAISTFCYDVHRKTIPKPFDALLTGLVFGNGVTSLPDDINDAYQKAGVIHLLVVSGAQVALLLTVFTRLCGLFRMTQLQVFICSSFFNLFFVLLTGAGPSIARAGLMAECALLAKVSGRGQHFYTTLALSAFLLLLIDPLYLFHIGFQLSFMATFALFYLAPILEERLVPYAGRFAAPLGIALAPLILSTPLIAFYFNRVSIVALPANLFVAMIVEFLVVTGFASTLLGLIGLFPLALFLDQGNYLVMLLLNKVIFWLSSLPYAQMNVAAPSLLFLGCFYICLFFVVEAWRTRRSLPRRQVIAAVGILLVLLFMPAFFSGRAAPLTMTVFDVGQGDSILIETPHHKRILVDGGAYAKGDRSPQRYISQRGINELEGIIVTHAHADHVNGLLPLIRDMRVRWVMINGMPSSLKEYVTFLEVARHKQVPVHMGVCGGTFYPDKDVVVYLLAPGRPFIQGTASSDNDNSVVCRIVYKKFSLLLPGDAAERAEAQMIASGVTLSSTVLKVGHHGSRWSSNRPFLTCVSPNAVIISCGKGNKFGHPHAEFMERLARYFSGTRVYRTDRDGTIVVGTDGESYGVKCQRMEDQ